MEKIIFLLFNNWCTFVLYLEIWRYIKSDAALLVIVMSVCTNIIKKAISGLK